MVGNFDVLQIRAAEGRSNAGLASRFSPLPETSPGYMCCVCDCDSNGD
jgi:hypothetical protein